MPFFFTHARSFYSSSLSFVYAATFELTDKNGKKYKFVLLLTQWLSDLGNKRYSTLSTAAQVRAVECYLKLARPLDDTSVRVALA